MKRILILLSAIVGSNLVIAQPEPLNINQQNSRKIQVAILFDASNSMDGLLEQAKSRLWNIVNELGTLRYQGQVPSIEISLYKYGHSELSATSNYIQQLVPLSTDLDLISKQLFEIKTNGGDEYCGAVIGTALFELNWSTNLSDLKMIYIAGNEPFNQGGIDYKEVCKNAATRQIFVNTIYCGDHAQGIREFWFDGAQIGLGDYFNINSNKAVVHIETPYDLKINAYNDSLNRTYLEYGTLGKEKKAEQVHQDVNAGILAPSTMTERSIAKSSANYMNYHWDLVDADKKGIDITKLKEDELPEELKGKTEEEKKAYIERKKLEREKYQAEINKMAKDRQTFIDEEMKKRATEGSTDDFGTSVNKSINTKGESIGFSKKVE